MQTESEELRELERQLSHPSGAKGIEIADMMHATNIGMTKASISALNLQPEQQILELGHGNGAHVEFLLKQAPGLHYTGLEISETMHDEARMVNAGAEAAGTATFLRYDGCRLPFDDGQFDRMFTVNCIYFWPEPAALLTEVARVLKPGGIAAITYAHKEFMLSLPFIRDRFRLYDDAGFLEVAAATPLEVIELRSETERVRTKAGDLVERNFTVGLLRK